MEDVNDPSTDDSSTEGEIDQLKQKLAAIEARTMEQLESQKTPECTFQCPLSYSDDDSSIGSSVSGIGDRNGGGGEGQSPQNVARRAIRQDGVPRVHHAASSPSSKQSSPHQSEASSVWTPPTTSRELPVVLAKKPPPVVGHLPSKSVVPRQGGTSAATTNAADNVDDQSTTSSSSSTSTLSSSDSSSSSSDDSSSSNSCSEESSSAKATMTSIPAADVAPARYQVKAVVNPYVAPHSTQSLKPMPVDVVDSPAVGPKAPPQATTMTKPSRDAKPKDVQPQYQEPALDLDDYLLFFGQDSDFELEEETEKASPHFVPAASAEKPRTVDASRGDGSIQRTRHAMPTQDNNDAASGLEGSVSTDPKEKTDGRLPQAATAMPIQDVLCPGSEQEPELEYSLYSPPPFQPRRPPALHKFHEANRPVASRRQIAVSDVFQPPVALLWKGRFERFNALQTELANPICHTNDHMVVSAPTGAGKTAVFEMAMARFIRTDLAAIPHGIRRFPRHRKMVYIAPSKALCEERLVDWSNRLASLNLGIQVTMITGDTIDPGAWFHELSSAHLVLTTPEKWDSITRKWTENFFLMATVKLVMVDEVHLLGDDSRGHCLEAIMTRMKSIQRAAVNVHATQEQINSSSYPHTTPASISASMRTVAVSATLPNITDVAEFVGASEAYAFDGSFRPVPLTKHVSAFGFVGNNEFKYWSSLDRHIPQLIHRFSGGKQTLIFCHTKGETERLCSTLIEHKFGKSGHTSAPPGTVDHCLAKGVAYHHGGLPPEEKNRIEQAFVAGKIACLCATSTLAVGVNLPARLVIVKGTRTWRGGGNGYQDIDKNSLLQMIGRAGRPGLDTTGIAVIMTDNRSRPIVESQIQGLGPAESRLLPKLVDVLNAEISQRVLTDMEGAMRWLKTTFLFGRIRQEPSKYAMDNSWRSVDAYLEHLLERSMRNLVEADLVEVSQDGYIKPLPACHVMSYGMVPFDSIKLIASLPYDASKCQILKILSRMEALNTHVRRNEKKALNECHKDEKIRFKLEGPLSKVRVQEPWEKAFVLLQAYIGQYSFDKNFGLAQQMTTVSNNAQRFLLAAQEFSIKGSRHGHNALMCLKLRRSLFFSLWENESAILNQIDGVGHQVASHLKMGGVNSFEKVLEFPEEELERLTKKPKPFGRDIKILVSKILQSKLKISANVTFTRGSGMAADVVCDLTLADPTSAILSGHKQGAATYTLIAFTDQPRTCVIFREGIAGPGSYRFSPPVRFGKLFIHLVGSLIGLDETLVLDGNDEATPSSFVEAPKGQKRRVGAKRISVDNPRMKPSEKPMRQGSVQRMLRNQCAREEAENTRKPMDPSSERSPVTASESQQPPSLQISRQPSSIQATARVPHPSSDLVGSQASHFGNPFQPSRASGFNGPSALENIYRDQGEIVRRHPVLRPSTPGFDPSFAAQEMPSNTRLKVNQDIPAIGMSNSITSWSPHAPRIATITPANAAPQRPYQSPTPRGFVQSRAVDSRKRQASNAWAANQKRQQRTQQRAFVSRRDNPFASFQHDPNDAESFLEDLSQRNNHSSSSIIAEEELQQIPFGRTRPGRFAMPQPPRVRNDQARQRQGFFNNQRLSAKEVLRMKAEEASSYAIASISPSHAVTISNRAWVPQYQGRVGVANFPPQEYCFPTAVHNFPLGNTNPAFHWDDGSDWSSNVLSQHHYSPMNSEVDPIHSFDGSYLYDENFEYSTESGPSQTQDGLIGSPEMQQLCQYPRLPQNMNQQINYVDDNGWRQGFYQPQHGIAERSPSLRLDEAIVPRGFY